jgi:hypothetical protein
MTASAERPGTPLLGVELLDDPAADPAAVRAQLRDIARLNRWFGGTRAVVRALEPLFRRFPGPARWSLLDVGTGSGDIPRAVMRAARRHGIALTALGLERSPAAARVANAAGVHATIGDGNAIPFRPRSVDIVLASQVLHHLPHGTACRWLRTLDGLARRAVIVADLQRSRPAMAGVWLAAALLGMSRSTRHDAVLSLRRGYKKEELEALLGEAGIQGRVWHSPWFRLVAAWDVHPAVDA